MLDAPVGPPLGGSIGMTLGAPVGYPLGGLIGMALGAHIQGTTNILIFKHIVKAPKFYTLGRV